MVSAFSGAVSTAAFLRAAVFFQQRQAADDQQSLPVVEANDNRTPAGTLKDGTLELDLVVQMSHWYPEEKDGPFAEVAAFGEEGKPPQIPGPLIRVPEGTTIVARVRNALPAHAVR